jgi:hypothetical protein
MAGLNLGTGASGSVIGSLYGGYGGASVPTATSVAEGPGTITQQAWGVPSASSGSNLGIGAAGISAGALILLIAFWWMLPR